MVRHWV